MIQTLFILATLSLNTQVKTAQIQPCIWPKCEKAPVVAQVQPCVWPKCEKSPIVDFKAASIVPANDFTSCQWPRVCNTNVTL